LFTPLVPETIHSCVSSDDSRVNDQRQAPAMMFPADDFTEGDDAIGD
jgi:hypothetical protein